MIMAEELKLTNEQRLMQRLSPLQAQYVSLVEMNRAEIEEKVRNEIDENPALEVKDSSDNDIPLAADNRDEDGDTFNESAEQMQLADYRDEDDIPYYRTNISNSSPDDEQRDAVVVAESSIIDFLNDQIAERDLSPRQQAIAKYIIGNIDDNGYLQRSIEEICDDLVFQMGMDVSDNDVKEVLQMVHDLEPAGIAAADDHNVFIGSTDLCSIGPSGIQKALGSGAQKVHCKINSLCVSSRCFDIPWILGSAG